MDKMYSIYKLVCNDLNIKYTYVGSTINVTNRKYKHKSDCDNQNRKHYNYKVYKTIRLNGGWENWNLVVIETLECTKQQAHTKERHWYEQLNANLNSNYPGRSPKEYRVDTKDERKEYLELHKVEIAEQKKEYRQDNKKILAEKAKVYREQHKIQNSNYAKVYRELHKVEIAAKAKIYRDEKKKLNQQDSTGSVI